MDELIVLMREGEIVLSLAGRRTLRVTPTEGRRVAEFVLRRSAPAAAANDRA